MYGCWANKRVAVDLRPYCDQRCAKWAKSELRLCPTATKRHLSLTLVGLAQEGATAADKIQRPRPSPSKAGAIFRDDTVATLKSALPFLAPGIRTVPNGQKGVDITIPIVDHMYQAVPYGLLLIECKDKYSNGFQSEWIPKLQQDRLDQHATFGILYALNPHPALRDHFTKDSGILVTDSISCLVTMIHMLTVSLATFAASSPDGQAVAEAALSDFITSAAFKDVANESFRDTQALVEQGFQLVKLGEDITDRAFRLLTTAILTNKTFNAITHQEQLPTTGLAIRVHKRVTLLMSHHTLQIPETTQGGQSQ